MTSLLLARPTPEGQTFPSSVSVNGFPNLMARAKTSSLKARTGPSWTWGRSQRAQAHALKLWISQWTSKTLPTHCGMYAPGAAGRTG